MKAILPCLLVLACVLSGCSGSLFPDTSRPVVEDLTYTPNPAHVNEEIQIYVTVTERQSDLTIVVSVDRNGDGIFDSEELSTLSGSAVGRVSLGIPGTWAEPGEKAVSVVAESDGGTTSVDSVVEILP